MAPLARFRSRGPTFADLTPYAALVANGVILLKDGSLMAGWYFAGPDSESSTDVERNEVCRQVNATLVRLGSGWMLQVEAVRLPSASYPSSAASHFPDPVTRAIDLERRGQFEASGAHFESQHALILTYRPPEPRRSRMVQYIYADGEHRSQGYADRVLEGFDRSIREFEQSLSGILSIRRMQTRETRDPLSGAVAHYDELFQFIRFCITGHSHPVRLPAIPMYLDWLATAQLEHGLTPRVDGRQLRIVSIDGLPSESWPGILNALNQMALAYRWSSRFIFLDEQDARSRLERTRKKWLQKVRPFLDQLFQTQSRALDQDAMGMVAETEDAIAQAASQLVAYGYYTSSVVLFSDDRDQVEIDAEATRRAIQAEGFGARIETLNATDAYLGTLPGNWYANVREPLIHTRNLADLVPLSSVWTGEPFAPCPLYDDDAPALMQVRSGSTPFRLNLHVDDVGHTLIFGPTGSGKSTLLALLVAQFRRYRQAQIFAFDKGHSLLALTLGAGGDHYVLGDQDRALAFCPLAELSTAADKAWASQWIETLLGLQAMTVRPEHRNAIVRQIELMSVERHGRSISHFVAGVQSKEIKDALIAYTVDGPMGQLLDAESDGLTLSDLQTFEIEQLMQLGERSLIPVLLYLFRRIERRLSGTPSLIVLDEAWLMLGHPVFREKIREWLKVLRKANCAVVLATQSISDAERSGIIDVLTESCPTKIFLANPVAQHQGTREFYESLGLNERQIEIIASATPKKDYYAVSPLGRRVFDLALGPVAISFVGASSPHDLKRVRLLNEVAGSYWPVQWLKDRGVENADELLGSA